MFVLKRWRWLEYVFNCYRLFSRLTEATANRLKDCVAHQPPLNPTSCLCASEIAQLLPSGLRTSAQTHIWHIGNSSQQYRFMNPYTPLDLQETQENSSLCSNSQNLCAAGVGYPSEDELFQQTAQHPSSRSPSWGRHSPKTTQINVWKWYLLSSSPWPLTKSTAALSNSANRISTKLNMSKC